MSDVTAEFAQRFAALFAGHTGAHGRYDESTGQKRVKTLEAPPPADAHQRHLDGDGPYLGIIPIRQDSTCYFGAIDLDDDGVDLHELEAKVVAHKLPLVVCRSKSGGAHLYCFLREPVPAQLLVEALKKWRRALGHERNANGMPVEIFPKQTKLAGAQLGNWINLPYWNAASTNRYAVTGGRQLSLVEFLDHATTRSVNERDLQTWADPSTGPFADGPPCLQKLYQLGFPEGGRNTGLFNVGLYFRARNAPGWETDLRDYNAQLAAPLDEPELAQIIRNIERHPDYIYTCDTHPLEQHCQKKACKQQPYGIGYFIKQRRLAELPELTGLVKIKTEPPRYRLRVNGNEVPLSAEQLQQGYLFKRVVFERLNLVIPVPKPGEWDEVLQTLIDTQVEEDAPIEAGDRGLLLMFLNDFLVLRVKSTGAEDVLRGLPWLDPTDRRVYFRATDFMGFLQRRQFKRFEAGELYTLLVSAAGLTFVDRVVKGAQVKLWSVPEPAGEQLEPFSFSEPTHPAAY